MKKWFCLALACLMVMGLCACGAAQEEKTPVAGLQVGFAMANITPDYSVPLQGGDYGKRWSEGVKDYCYATCIAMKNGEETALIFTIDIKLMTGVGDKNIKAAITQSTGIPASNIFMNATHTHSAPAIRYTWDGSFGYVTEFTNAVIAAAEEAVADLAPATAAAGYTQTEGFAFIRHYIMNDGSVSGSNFGAESDVVNRKAHAQESDGQMGLVHFKREGKKDVILVNFGVHPTFNGDGGDKMISADFPSPLRDYVAEEMDAHVAYFTAAAGDQVRKSTLAGLSKVTDKNYVKYGELLGQCVIDALPTLTPIEGDSIRLINRDMTYATNKENLDKRPDQLNGPFEATWIGIRSELGPTRTMTIRTLAVGNLGFVSAPYEMMAEQGKYIKENSPFPTTVIMTCGEGDNSYVANIKGFEYNSYESQVCFYARGVAEQAAKDLVSMLEELK